MHLLTSLIYVPVLIGIVLIALLTAARRRSPDVIAFSVLSLSLALWLLPQYIAQLGTVDKHSTLALHLIQTTSALSNVIAYSFITFVLFEIGQYRKRGKPLHYATIIFVLFMVLNYSSMMITRVTASVQGIVINAAGFLYIVQILFVAACFVTSMILLGSYVAKQPKRLRTNGYILLIAMGQAIVTITIGSSVFAASAAAQLTIPISLFIMVALIAYAIVRHQLFDIRPVVARSLAYATSVLAVSAIYGFVVFSILHIVFNINFATRYLVLISIATGLSALGFSRLKQFFDKMTNNLFYSDAYDSQTLLDSLSRILVSTLDLTMLLQSVADLLIATMKLEQCSFFIEGTKKTDVHFIGGEVERSKRLMHTLRRLSMKSTAELILVSTIKDVSIREALAGEGVEALMSVVAHEDGVGAKRAFVGYCILGQKKSGSPYTAQDQSVFRLAINEMSIAVQNTLQYEEIKNFSAKLAEEVENATHKLRYSNEKLRQIDETKDDFIGMASHQLRTPLTSVKGYLSLVLEGDAGHITAQQRKLLSQAFISSQRMVFLIADLLNVSRLKTGKFLIETMPVDLAQMIKDEVEQLRETAAARQLVIHYEMPTHFPMTNLDETKTRQVVMNFLDNAIYYTPSGGEITIMLTETQKSIELRIKDNGIGVPKSEQHHLFTKFYRAKNAQKARPDGTGLGLFMAQKVIIAQGGAIIFESKEGQGSTFGFMFPKSKVLAQS